MKAGFGNVPVASLNFSGLEKDSGFSLTVPLLRKVVSAVFYGDELMCLANQVRPYEQTPGAADAVVARWLRVLAAQYDDRRGVTKRDMRRNFAAIAADFAAVPVHWCPRVKVGVVGEIYVKYAALGNNGLEAFLAGEGCEVNVPGLMGFVQYCVENMRETARLYGGDTWLARAAGVIQDFLDTREEMMLAAIARYPQFHAPMPFEKMKKMAQGIISYGVKMGEGWLLTAEMVELVHAGFENIVCAQPFGCLPNHISGKGMINKIRTLYPSANITPIDYDPSATRVNQENRIRLMLSVAKERLQAPAPARPQPLYGAEGTVEAKLEPAL